MFGRSKTAGRILLLPLDHLEPNPCQPRRYFNPDELDSLASSIRTHGILQPLSVRQRPDRADHYQIIAGERRYRAARIAGLQEVPCRILEADDQQMAVYALIENIQRQDLTFFEEATAIQRLISEYRLTQEQAAERLGKAQSTVANKLRLLRLSPAERLRIEQGELTERHARALLRVEDPVRRGKLIETVITLRLNVAETEQLIEAQLTPATPADPQPVKPRRRMVVKDVRLFVNTIHKAVETMRQSGIEAIATMAETEDALEYRVRIPCSAAYRAQAKVPLHSQMPE